MANLSSLTAINDLKKSIVIDEEALNKAGQDFLELCGKIDALLMDVTNMLEALKSGFDTPAGRTFMKSCENCLLEPIQQQKIVVTHIAENLLMAKNMYQSVFTDYRDVVYTLSN